VEFKDSPEYAAGRAGFEEGRSSLQNPFIRRPPPSIAHWLWACGWADALRDSMKQVKK
jgi:hypothetical protein